MKNGQHLPASYKTNPQPGAPACLWTLCAPTYELRKSIILDRLTAKGGLEVGVAPFLFSLRYSEHKGRQGFWRPFGHETSAKLELSGDQKAI